MTWSLAYSGWPISNAERMNEISRVGNLNESNTSFYRATVATVSQYGANINNDPINPAWTPKTTTTNIKWHYPIVRIYYHTKNCPLIFFLYHKTHTLELAKRPSDYLVKQLNKSFFFGGNHKSELLLNYAAVGGRGGRGWSRYRNYYRLWKTRKYERASDPRRLYVGSCLREDDLQAFHLCVAARDGSKMFLRILHRKHTMYSCTILVEVIRSNGLTTVQRRSYCIYSSDHFQL